MKTQKPPRGRLEAPQTAQRDPFWGTDLDFPRGRISPTGFLGSARATKPRDGPQKRGIQSLQGVDGHGVSERIHGWITTRVHPTGGKATQEPSLMLTRLYALRIHKVTHCVAG